jgi:putative nucleotidyltransferase with HDIG domain
MKIETIFQLIHKTAKELNYEVYVVGGYVRDKLLNIKDKDLDFVVVGDALTFAERLKKNMHLRKIVVYPRFGTFMADYYGYSLEFVNAREESYADDSRKPHTKQADLLTDLSRRDFTINTLAMDISPENFGRIIDVYDGQGDLKRGIIRTPLEPNRTFSDDPLRMMRAVRFSTRLGFKIEEETYQAIKNSAHRLKIVSQERITDEFTQIIMGKNPHKGVLTLEETGLLKIFLPELSSAKGIDQRKDFHHKDVFYHTLEVLHNVSKVSDKKGLRLAAIFHDIAKPKTKKFVENIGWTFHGHEVVGERMTSGIMRRLKYPGDLIAYVKKLVRLHLRPMAMVSEIVTDSAIRRLLFLAGDDVDDLMILCRADITSKNMQRVKEYLNNYEHVVKRMKEVEERDRMRNFQPPVDGKEIMEKFQIPPGPQIGKIKKFIEEAILNGDVANEHDACMNLIIEHKEELGIS